MKNYVYYGLLSVFLINYSCSEQESIIEESIDTSISEVDEKTISFSNREDFEILFSEPDYINQKTEGLINFTSLMSLMPSEDENIPNARSTSNPSDSIYEDYGIITEILNEDKIVKIGDHLIKVDLHTERVLVLPYEFANEYADLVNNNTNNEHIIVFSTDDEVLSLLEGNSSGTINGRTEIACGTPDDPVADTERASSERTASNRRRRRLTAKLVYQRSGIAFRVLAKGRVQKRSLRTWFRERRNSPELRFSALIDVRCQENNIILNNRLFVGDNDGIVTHVAYSGSRRLESYFATATFRSIYGNIGDVSGVGQFDGLLIDG